MIIVPSAIVYGHVGEYQANIECAESDLGAAEWFVLTSMAISILLPSVCVTLYPVFKFSRDEFVLVLLSARFKVSLLVELGELMRQAINAQTKAAGTATFSGSLTLAILVQVDLLWRRKRLQYEPI